MPGESQNGLKWTIALVRVAVGVMFILFGWYKVTSPAFANGGIQQYLTRFVDQHMAVGFYRPFLTNVALPHAKWFGYGVGVAELLIGLAMISGILVRAAALGGVLYMANFLLSEWNGPGPNAPTWQYFGAQLDHIGLLLLFLIFMADAEPKLSLRPLLRRRR